MQEQIQQQQQVLDEASTLYEQGWLKQLPDGSWKGVDTLEEKQALLAQRAEEAAKTKQLEQQVNINPPPQIDSSRQRAGNQLELNDPAEVLQSIVKNNQARPASQTSSNAGGGNSYRVLSRRGAADKNNASKQGK